MDEISIRQAALRDAPAMAALHVTAWQQAYRTLAPPEAAIVLDEAYRLEKWRNKLSSPGDDQLVLVAEHEARLVGFAAAGAPSQDIFGDRGELKFLYIDPKLKRRGVGRLLVSALARHLSEQGYVGAALGVVESNDDALAFYLALGGRVIGRYVDPGPIWRSLNNVVVWDDLSLLMRGA